MEGGCVVFCACLRAWKGEEIGKTAQKKRLKLGLTNHRTGRIIFHEVSES